MSSSDIAVSVRDLSKSYTIAHEDQKHTLASEALLHSIKNIGKKSSSETFWALKDVSFDINKGDVVGIIGRNGAGKSTLLKILSRITAPTSGQIDLYGRVGSLLEVGTGFHPELTGRENTYLNGAILGMSKREIAKHFDAIVDFSGVEKFLDTPVKRYSSGMYVRLAFAVAAHLEPEILIVDEVLAVGDAEFQKKCLGKMQDVAAHGRTVLFVSHNMGAVKNLCKYVAFLKQGKLANFGKTAQIITEYLTEDATFTGLWSRQDPLPDQRGIFFQEISLANSEHLVTGNIASHEDFFVRLTVHATENVDDIQIAVRLTNQDGVPVFTTANTDEASRYPTIKRGEHYYHVKIPASFLVPGSYNILAATLTPGSMLFDLVEDKIAFVVEDTGTHATSLRDGRLGLVTPLLHWNEQVENTTTYETALIR